jgi:hypothetical protein
LSLKILRLKKVFFLNSDKSFLIFRMITSMEKNHFLKMLPCPIVSTLHKKSVEILESTVNIHCGEKMNNS